MRFLTLTQPWCGLVAAGMKLIECRRRPVISSADFGRPFCLHAGRKVDERIYDTIRAVSPALFSSVSPPRACWYRLSRVTSATIAVATIRRAVVWRDADPRSRILVDYHTHEHVDPGELGDQLRWFLYGIGYVLAAPPVVLPRPVHHPGGRGFRHMTDEASVAVSRQLDEASRRARGCWYLRRDDDRTVLELGAGVGSWQDFLGYGAATVVQAGQEADLMRSLEEATADAQMASRVARSIVAWSDGRPFRFVGEDELEDSEQQG